MASKLSFTDEEMAIDEALGYPKAFARLCRNPQLFNPFSKGPPFSFVPYVLQSQDALRARELNQMFPIIDSENKPSANSKIYIDILWKRLNHLGNAGFDPDMFRVDPYGNVLYFYADPASPLAWEIDHWFPCSRGGRTLPANLRLLQWQVSKRKKNKLEFLVPWWDLQLGISVNQFLSIFASRNSEFRNRAFSLLFTEGENDQVDNSQIFDCHAFPQHFMEKKRLVGLAPAAVVLLQRDSEPLKSLDFNKPPRPSASSIARKFIAQEDASLCKAVQRFRPGSCKENEESDLSNQYTAMARESLKQREETAKKEAEMWELEEELNELKQKNEIERQALQDLECLLIKRRRRVEKCRRLAEAQSNYKTLLEKMIRDAMHQSVVYKEQVRMNQAATSALTARLEAQKAICDSSEKELHRRYKQRDEIEKQIRPYWEQARKRSRMDDTPSEEWHGKTGNQFPAIRPRRSLQKELRLFLEEEQKASEAGVSLDEDLKQEEEEAEAKESTTALVEEESCREDSSPLKITEHTDELDEKLTKLAIQEGNCSKIDEQKEIKGSFPPSPEEVVDEEYRRKIGKGNVDKWLQMLLESTQEGSILDSPPIDFKKEHMNNKTEELIKKMNSENPQQEIKVLRLQPKEELGLNQEVLKPGKKKMVSEEASGFKLEERDAEKKMEKKAEIVGIEETAGFLREVGSSKSFEAKEKERKLVRCASARTFGSVPASPSVIWGVKRGVDCIGKKPMVDGDDDGDVESHAPVNNNFLKISIKALKKAVKK